MAFTDKLTAIANAIRGQSNKTAKLSLDQMPVEITNLPTIGFEIIGGTSAPGNPKTNDIWVNTPHAITGWGFIDRNPGWSHNDGWVYVVAAVSLLAIPTDFNAMKLSNTFQREIWLRPFSAWQYVGGTWILLPAKIYNGEWYDFSLILVSNNTIISMPTVWGEDGLSLISLSGNTMNWAAGTVAGGYEFPAIDVTNRSSVYAKLSYTLGENIGFCQMLLSDGSAVTTIGTSGASETNVEVLLDVSSISGEKTLRFYVQGGGGKGAASITIHELRIE